MPLYRLNVRSEFSAAHRLRNYQGKCEAMHGHNFGVEVAVEGRGTDPQTGMLLDFGILKRELKSVLEELDHADLNELPTFIELNPSSEHLARHICTRLAERLREHPVRVAWVTVSEKAAQSATYISESEDLG